MTYDDELEDEHERKWGKVADLPRQAINAAERVERALDRLAEGAVAA